MAPRWPQLPPVWGTVVGAGLVFSVGDVRPVPAIVAAQAFNGILLPIAAYFLLAATSDRRVLSGMRNSPLASAFGVAVLAIATLIGMTALMRATVTATGMPAPDPLIVAVGGAGLGLALGIAAVRPRRAERL